MAPRTSVLEFPEALMKEELPKGDFHTQEERRLFYVALTRARERLTLTTVVHKRSKPSVFLDDILSAPKLARQNVEQLAPAARRAARLPRAGERRGDCVHRSSTRHARRSARVYSRIGEWALSYRPPVFEPLQLSASAIETYQSCPQQYLFSEVWGIPGGPRAATTFGNVMHTTIKQFIGGAAQGAAAASSKRSRRFSGANGPRRASKTAIRKNATSATASSSCARSMHSCLAAPPDVWRRKSASRSTWKTACRVTGRMDQINRLGPGEVEIVDYKTGKPKTERAGATKICNWASTLWRRARSWSWNPTRLVYYNLQTNKCVAASATKNNFSEVRGTIQEVAADIRAREFPANPGFCCKTCEFRFLCPAQEPRTPAVGRSPRRAYAASEAASPAAPR